LNVRRAFYAPTGELRSSWRILIFLCIAIAGTVVAGIALVPYLGALLAPTRLTVDRDVWSLLVGMLAAHWAMLLWFEPPAPAPPPTPSLIPARPTHRPNWAFVGLARENTRWQSLVGSFALGAFAIGLPTALMLGTHWLSIVPGTPGSWIGAAIRLTWFLLPAALWEELFSRGYVFAVLRSAWGWPATLVATSLVFGLLHLDNPGADLRSAALVTLAGLFLGAVLVFTRSLYAAWLAHFGWNWMMAVVFHSAVSGLPMEAPNYRVVDNGPDWATGGSWGPEGGALAGAGMIAALTYLIARLRRREES